MSALFVMTGVQLFLGDQLGSDYTFFLPRLLYGYFWQIENGVISIPWFSPAWCGGLPFYGDPQVMFFSVPQLLMNFLDPQQVVFATYVFFGFTGAFGFYLLLTRSFQLNAWLALVGSVLFAFNEFYLFRLLTGHFTYHMFPLIPLVSFFIISAVQSQQWKKVFNLLLSGCLIAYFVHGGAANFLIPAMLSVLVLLLIYSLGVATPAYRFVSHLVYSGAIGFCFSVSKIAASFAFVRWFPRESLSLGIFDGLRESVWSTITLLFMNPWISLNEIQSSYLVQAHELRFGVTLIPALLLLLGVAAVPSIIQKLNLRNLGIIALIVIVCSLPVILSVKSDAIDAILKSLPYFREMSLAVRWIALLIPIVIIVPLILVQRLLDDMAGEAPRQRLTGAVVAVSLIGVLVSHLLTERPRDAQYNPMRLTTSYYHAKQGGSVPAISVISSQPDKKTFIGVDDDFVAGGSSKVCYQAIFGYALERYPVKSLRDGSVFDVRSGKINIKNPACYLFPEENACKLGDHFTIDQQDEAAKFATNQPFDWQMPWWQTVANWLNGFAVIAGLLTLLIATIRVVIVRD